MNILFKNGLFTLMQNQVNKQIFEIEFLHRPPPLLMDSLIETGIIEHATLSDDYKTIRFKAFSVKPFLFDHNVGSASQMLSTLTKQLEFLIRRGKTFIGYNTKNMIVINDTRFVFLDADLLTDIVNDDFCIIRCPFSAMDFYASPELLRIAEIPARVHYKTAYFSLGFLLLEVVSGKKGGGFYKEYLQGYQKEKREKEKEKGEKEKEEKEKKEEKPEGPIAFLNNYLYPIKNTKLYWLLERSLVEDPLERSLLFL
jgi:hypothetical protein